MKQVFLVPVDEKAVVWVKYYVRVEANSKEEALSKIDEEITTNDVFGKFEMAQIQGEISECVDVIVQDTSDYELDDILLEEAV